MRLFVATAIFANVLNALAGLVFLGLGNPPPRSLGGMAFEVFTCAFVAWWGYAVLRDGK